MCKTFFLKATWSFNTGKLYMLNHSTGKKKYNNTYHATTKTKPFNVKSKTYINFNKENYYKDPKFKIGDYVIISECKNIFAKGYIPNWSKEAFL